MLHFVPDIAPAKAARVAGIGYAMIFVLALFANFFVRVRLIDPEVAAVTFANVAASEMLVRFALVAFLCVFFIDVIVAWALHHVFRAVAASASSLAAWFRIVYTVFLSVATLFLFIALQLVSGAEHLAAFEQDELDSLLVMSLNAFNATWMIGLAAFGVHLVLVGSIILRTGIASKVLGAMLGVAGIAYVFDTLAFSLLSNYDAHETLFVSIVAGPSIIAELAFTIWLLLGARGGLLYLEALNSLRITFE